MAKEPWTVFYEIESAGAQEPINFKEKDIVVEGKEKCSGLIAAEQLKSIKEGNILNTTIASNKIFNGGGPTSGKFLQTNVVNRAYFVTIEAEGASEACKALRTFLSPSVVMGRCLAAPWGSAKLEEVEAIP